MHLIRGIGLIQEMRRVVMRRRKEGIHKDRAEEGWNEEEERRNK